MKTETPTFQLHKSKALAAAHAATRRLNLRRCVVREKRVFGQGIQEIAKRHEIGYNDVLDLLEEQSAEDVQRARCQGFQDGRRSAKFAPLPSHDLRRAA